MTWRGTALLGAVLAVLGAWVWFVEWAPPGPPTGEPALLAVPRDAVARIEVEGPQGRLVAHRRDAGWVDGDGRPWHAERVDDLVAALATLRPVMIVDERPATPGDYGLDEAVRVRAVEGDGRTVLDLELGARNPAGTGVYARWTDRPEVMLVGALLEWELRKLREAAPTR